ncbi:M56 family metallopeptidase [Saccharopolyspora sp. NPDC000359]|uniref:M56 family metallopeptidase n=1 Tax=Saccharopolyspora sp. NPDC000359 TaxID=3154251 RepID=UPI0033207BE5
MSTDLLGYPQIVVTVWGPLAAIALWHATRPLTRRLPPRERFVLAVLTAMTPLLAMSVPYLPGSPARDLPWRAPHAWGITNYVFPIDPQDVVATASAYVFHAVWVLPFASLAVSFAAGAVQVVRTARRVAALAPERRGEVWLVRSDRLGVACTVGLLRPRILLGSGVPPAHAPAIIAHERVHAAARHPLWIFLATCSLRAWWWLPGWRAVLAEARLAAELRADQGAREAQGAGAVAKALLAHLDVAASPAVASSTFAARNTEFVHRARALATPPRDVPAAQLWSARVTGGLAIALVIILL